MILKTLTWPDGGAHQTFVLTRDEFAHLFDVGKAGPYAGKIYVSESSIAAVAPTHALLAETRGDSGTNSVFVAHSVAEFLTANGLMKFKDFMKGSKKDTYIFLRVDSGLTHLMRINCHMPEGEEWDRLSIEHSFILQGSPVENKSVAYKTADVKQAISNRADELINPDPSLWGLFVGDVGRMPPPTSVVIQLSVLEHLAETAKVCSGFVTAIFDRLNDGVILVEFGDSVCSRWKHIFTEVKKNVQMEQVPTL